MKKRIMRIACILAAGTMLASCGTSKKLIETTKTTVVFNEALYDFGTFSRTAQSEVSHYFVFTNTGKAPLTITGIETTCGCTTADYPKKAVKPGDKDSIRVTFIGTDMPLGPFRKGVEVFANTQTGVERLYVEGNMEE